MDDFPALMSLYAGAQAPTANKRSRSGTLRRKGGGEEEDAGVAEARTRVNKSLVMSVEKIAATARLWSLVPWSNVRRYDRVHVKGITLRLKQVMGILNFSFVALNKKVQDAGGGGGVAGGGGGGGSVGDGSGGGGSGSGSGGPADGGRRNRSFGEGIDAEGRAGGAELGGFAGAAAAAAAGQSTSRSMEDLDGIDLDGEYVDDIGEVDDDEEHGDDVCYELEEEDAGLLGDVAGVGDGGGGAAREDRGRLGADGVPELVRRRSRSSSTATMSEETPLRSQSVTTCGGAGAAEGGGGTETGGWRTLAPWAPATNKSGGTGAGGGGGSNSGHAPGGRMRSMSLSVRPKRSTLPAPSSPENLGKASLGVFKVLGEAFMRRFNAYSDQVRGGGRFAR